MGARKMIYGLTVQLRDKASRGLKKITDRLQGVRRASRRVTRGRGLSGLLSGGLGGGMASATAAGGPQGGIGGMVSGLMKGATKLATMPLKIISGFSRIIPAVGGIFSGVVGTATNALQTIANTAANVVGSVINAFASLAKSVVRVFGKILKTATRVFGKVSMIAGGAFVAGTGAAVKFAGSVEDAWNKVRSIIDLGSAADRIRMQLRDLATRTGRGLTEIMEGYYQTISAGFKDPAQAMEVMKASLKGAVGGAANFGTVVKTVSRTMRNFGDAIKSPREAMDVLLKTVDVGQIEMPELANVFGRVANAAGMVGAKFRETAAALGVMAQTGPAEVVATQLRGFFLALKKPTKQAKEAMQALKRRGIDVTKKALDRLGLVKYLKRLKKAPKDVLTKIFADRRALMGVSTLMKMLPDVESALGDLRNAAGKTKSNFRKVMDAINKQAARAWQAVKDLALEYAQPISQVLKRWLKAVPAQLKKWRPAAKAAGKAVASALQTALQYGKRIYKWLSSIDWSKAFKGLKQLPGELASDVLPKIQALFGRMTKQGFEPGPVLNALVSAFKWAAAKIEGILSALWERVGRDLLRTLMQSIQNVAQAISSRIIESEREAAKEWYNTSWAFAGDRAMEGQWEDLEDDRQKELIQAWANKHPIKAAANDKMLGIAQSIRGMALDAMPESRTKEEQEQAAQKAKAEADKKAAKAAQNLGTALNNLAKATKQTVQAAGKEVNEALPKKQKPTKSAAQKAEDNRQAKRQEERDRVAALENTEKYQKAQSKIERKRSLMGQLTRTGHQAKAFKIHDEVRQLEKALEIVRDAVEKEGLNRGTKAMLDLATRDPGRAIEAYGPQKTADKRQQPDETKQQAERVQEGENAVAKEMARARSGIRTLFDKMAQRQEETKKEIKRLKRTVNALSTTRV